MNKAKKIFKTILKVIGVIFAVIVLAVIVLTIRNGIKNRSDAKLIEGAYGEEYVLSTGEKMNYTFYDSTSDKVAVILPGFGSSSVHYEFDAVAKGLKDDYKIIIVEPLGYGLSDNTDRDRTVDNYCDELHQLMSYLMESQDFDSYTIIGHSIAGLYAVKYANLYEDEVDAFIGIDASVPCQVDAPSMKAQNDSTATTYKANRLLLVDTGIYRLLTDLSIDMTMSQIPTIPESEKEIFHAMNCNEQLNDTQIDEIGRLKSNLTECKDLKFPESVPVLYVLSGDNCKAIPEWEKLHKDIVTDPDSKVVVIDGPHYLHLYNLDGLMNEIDKWIS